MHRRDHQKAGNGDFGAAEREGQRAADGPEHGDEGERRQRRGGDADREIDRGVGRNPQILGQPPFRILVVAADQVELVVAPVLQPGVEHVIGKPGAPAPLRGHAAIDVDDAEADACRGQRKEDQRQREDGCGIALFEAVEDRAIPDIDAVLGGDREQHQHEQSDREWPGQTIAAFPEPDRGMPEALLERAPSLLLALGLGFRIVAFGFDLFRRLCCGVVERGFVLFLVFGRFFSRFLRRCRNLWVFVAVFRRLHRVR